jgi:hypothetical protein
MSITEWLKKVYGYIGLYWSGSEVYVVSAAISSALALNIIRRICEGALFGWSRFKLHDRNTLLISWIRSLFYVILVFFTLGVLGEKYSKTLDLVDIFFVANGTFLLGIIVNIIDDAISSTIVCLSKRRWCNKILFYVEG